MLLFVSLPLEAKLSKGLLKVYNKAYNLTIDERYNESLSVLAKEFHFTQQLEKAPVEVLELAIINYKKLKKYKNTLILYHSLIYQRFYLIDKKIKDTLGTKKSKFIIDQAPYNLIRYYYGIALVYYYIINDKSFPHVLTEYNKWKSKYDFYINICSMSEFEFGNKSISSIQTTLNGSLDKKKRSIKYFGYLMSFGLLFESDLLNNFESDSLSTTISLAVFQENYFWGWRLKGLFAHGNTEYKAKEKDENNSIPVGSINTFILSPSIYSSFGISEKFKLLFSPVIKYRLNGSVKLRSLIGGEFKMGNIGLLLQTNIFGSDDENIGLLQVLLYL
ncbi:MAG: hypothetical protein HOJ35_11405 [Bdellovibrionales bacterium]|nr:hypothetical protein [Bdellovibrionales bacterium]